MAVTYILFILSKSEQNSDWKDTLKTWCIFIYSLLSAPVRASVCGGGWGKGEGDISECSSYYINDSQT